MKIEIEKLDCTNIQNYANSNRKLPFWIAKLSFYYETSKLDKAILNKIENGGKQLAGNVNVGTANNSESNRSSERILSNAIAGVLSEYAWKLFLNSISLELLVRETPCLDVAHQIDLETVVNEKSIEVRSSFPRNGIEFAICHKVHEFDILGPYNNSYKPGEPQKDFYVRALYKVPSPNTFLKEYKNDGFTCYLTGGATWDMMMDGNIAINKTLIPEDSVSAIINETEYRVVPFSRALDSVEIYKLIKKQS